MRKNQISEEKNNIRILALDDDNIMTLTIQSYFRTSGYYVDIENDPYAAIERIRDGNYDILLLDFLMSPICGDTVVAEIRKFNTDIFIVLLTGHKSMAPPIRTIRELDIQGYYEKSDRFDQLELLVESCVKSIRQMQIIREYRDSLAQTNDELSEAYVKLSQNYSDIVNAIRSMVDARDIYTRGHSDRVSILSTKIAEAMGHREEEIQRIRVAALFHDIGKLRIPDRILLKEGRLTEEEFTEIRKHPLYALDILSSSSIFDDIISTVRSHHERYDGSGYPDGLRGQEIPETARIISIADAFDAMTSFRRYRTNISIDEALDEISSGRGTQFDPEIADVALVVLKNFEQIENDPNWVYPTRD